MIKNVKPQKTLDFDLVLDTSKTKSMNDGTVCIEGYANTSDKDRVGDVVLPSAFEKSLPEYMENPVLLFQHNWDKVIGNVTDAEVRDKGLYIKAKISKAEDVADVRTKILEKSLRTFSIGYNEKDAVYDESTKSNVIKELELLEISVVTIPANSGAKFTVVEEQKSEPMNGDEDVIKTLEGMGPDFLSFFVEAVKALDDGEVVDLAFVQELKKLFEDSEVPTQTKALEEEKGGAGSGGARAGAGRHRIEGGDRGASKDTIAALSHHISTLSDKDKYALRVTVSGKPASSEVYKRGIDIINQMHHDLKYSTDGFGLNDIIEAMGDKPSKKDADGTSEQEASFKPDNADEIKKEILNMFQANNFAPNDDAIHALADKLQLSPHDLETMIYAILGEYLKGQEKGGAGSGGARQGAGRHRGELPPHLAALADRIENDPKLRNILNNAVNTHVTDETPEGYGPESSNPSDPSSPGTGVPLKDSPIWVKQEGESHLLQVGMNGYVYTVGSYIGPKSANAQADKYASGFVNLPKNDWRGNEIGKEPSEEKLPKGKLPKGIVNLNNPTNKSALTDELTMGEKVELEHEGTIRALISSLNPKLSEDEIKNIVKEVASSIAKDHLKEMSDYYTRLAKMEGNDKELGNNLSDDA